MPQPEEPSTFHQLGRSNNTGILWEVSFPFSSISPFQFLTHTAVTRMEQSSILSLCCLCQRASCPAKSAQKLLPSLSWFCGWQWLFKNGKTKNWKTFPSSKNGLVLSQNWTWEWPQFFSESPPGSYSELALFAAKTCVVWCSALVKDSQNLFTCQTCYETSGCRLQAAQLSSGFCFTCNERNVLHRAYLPSQRTRIRLSQESSMP